MKQVGYDLTTHTSKGLGAFKGQEFDAAVTMGVATSAHLSWPGVSGDAKTARYSRACDCEAAARRDVMLAANERELADAPRG
jgi:hypothetical protein